MKKKLIFTLPVIALALIASASPVHASSVYGPSDYTTNQTSNATCTTGSVVADDATINPPSGFSSNPRIYCLVVDKDVWQPNAADGFPNKKTTTRYTWYVNDTYASPNGPANTTSKAATSSPTGGYGTGETETWTATTYTITGGPSSSVPSVNTFNAATASIAKGETDLLTWKCDDSTSAQIQPSLTGDGTGGISSGQATSGSYAVKPLQTTNYVLTCLDSSSNTATQTLTVTVNNPTNLTAACVATPSSSAPGAQTTWSATVSGGVKPYSYEWDGDGTSAGNNTNSTFVTTYNASGGKSMALTVTDNNNTQSQTGYTLYQDGAVGRSAGTGSQTICSGSSTGYSVTDVEDGGTASNFRKFVPYLISPYDSSSPAGYQANPDQYCVQQLITQSNNQDNCSEFGSGECHIYITDTLYNGSGITTAPPPPESWQISHGGSSPYNNYFQDTATYVKNSTPGSSPSTVVTKCTANTTGNQPPGVPTLICPTNTTGSIGQKIVFQISGTDPDGDKLRYGLVWDAASKNGVFDPPDTWIPASGYTNSGTQLNVSHIWNANGVYTVLGFSQDSHGTDSDFYGSSNTCKITIGTYPDLTAGDVTPTGATVGTAVTLASVISDSTFMSGKPYTDLFQEASDTAGTNASDMGTYANASTTASATTNAQLPWTFNKAGTYYLRACADKSSAGDTGVITESDETNNCSPDWLQFTVCPTGQNWNGTACTPTTPAPICTLTSNITQLDSTHSTATLTWGSTYATSCTPTGAGFSTGGALSGTASVGAGSYSLTCYNSTGSTVCQAPVTILPPPGSDCTADPKVDITAAPIIAGVVGTQSQGPIRVHAPTTSNPKNADLHFGQIQTDGTGGCTITGSDGTSYPFPLNGCYVNGTDQQVAVTTQTKYTLTCSGTPSDYVIVNVIPAFQEF